MSESKIKQTEEEAAQADASLYSKANQKHRLKIGDYVLARGQNAVLFGQIMGWLDDGDIDKEPRQYLVKVDGADTKAFASALCQEHQYK